MLPRLPVSNDPSKGPQIILDVLFVGLVERILEINWTRLDWIGLDWNGPDWTGLGLDWDRIGLD